MDVNKKFKGLSSKQRNSYWKCLVEFSLKYIVLCIYFLKNDLFIRLPVTTIHIISYGKLQTHYIEHLLRWDLTKPLPVHVILWHRNRSPKESLKSDGNTHFPLILHPVSM